MRIALPLLILALSMARTAAADPAVCVTNGTAHSYLFAAEVSDRVTATLYPGQTLCTPGGEGGVVSVFHSADALEGCSRLVDPGGPETLLRYADFDRCAWSSHQKSP